MADKYVTVAGAGTKAGTSWANAFDLAAWDVDLEVMASAGDRYYVEEGTYVFTGNTASGIDGTLTNPIVIIGVKASTTAEPPTQSDWATGDNRPLIAASSYSFSFDNYWQIFNLSVITTSADGLKMDIGGFLHNCRVANTSPTANRKAVYLGANFGGAFNCEFVSLNGYAVRATAVGAYMENCWVHDSSVGILADSDGMVIRGCNVDKCTTGIDTGTNGGCRIVNNTINRCTTGLDFTGPGDGNFALNNNISNCTTGATATSGRWNFLDYNNFYNNTTDRTNVTAGSNDTANNPNFTRDRVEGTATGGSTTTLIDTTTNFVDEGVLVGDTVQNTSNKEASIITSITTTTNTNDTLNFTAMPSSNDSADGYSISGDYSLQSGSDLIDAGQGMGLGVG